jgi:hypothetical protein
MTSALPGLPDMIGRALVSGYRNRWRDSSVEAKRKNLQFGSTEGNGGEVLEATG